MSGRSYPKLTKLDRNIQDPVRKVILCSTFQYPAPGTDWTPGATGATLAAGKTAKKCWCPVNLEIGDIVIGYRIAGNVVETNAATLDCKFVKVNLADPLTTSDIAGGGITQVTADKTFDVAVTLTAPEIAATDQAYNFELVGTTGVGDTIKVLVIEVIIDRHLQQAGE